MNTQTLEQYLNRVLEVSRVPGVCVSLRLPGVVYDIATGTRAVDDMEPLVPGTRFQLGCIIKSLLSAVALELCNERVIAPDVPVGDLIPELARSPKGRHVRVWHLMCHTTGYTGIGFMDPAATPSSWGDFIKHVHDAPQLFAPGTVYNYDQTTAVLLDRILENVTKCPSSTLIEDMILEPLERSCGQDEESRPYAIGHVHGISQGALVRCPDNHFPPPLWRSSISDRGRSMRGTAMLAELFMTGKLPGTGCRILSAYTVESLGRSVIDVPAVVGGKHSHCLPIGSGLGLAAFRHETYGQDGTGCGQVAGMRFSRRHGIALGVGVNAHAPAVRWRIIDAVLGELGIASRSREAPSPLEVDVGRLAGRYSGIAGFKASVAVRGYEIDITLQARGNPRPAVVKATIETDGRLSVRGRQPTAGVAFFAAPDTGEPCLMLGVHALKKVSKQTRDYEHAQM